MWLTHAPSGAAAAQRSTAARSGFGEVGTDKHVERALDRRHALAGVERLEDDEHRRGERRQVDRLRARDQIELAPHLGHRPSERAVGALPLAAQPVHGLPRFGKLASLAGASQTTGSGLTLPPRECSKLQIEYRCAALR